MKPSFTIREYRSGSVIERSLYPTVSPVKERLLRRKGATTERKHMQNLRDTTKRVARLINCNFNYGDLHVTLKYPPARLQTLYEAILSRGEEITPETIRKQAQHDLQLYLRRIKRELKKRGVELRYIAVTSDEDGKSGDAARIHHHVLLPKEAYAAALRNWDSDACYCQVLKDQKDYTRIAVYLLRQSKKARDIKKYSASRNLRKPEIKDTSVLGKKRLEAPKGAIVMENAEYRPDKPTDYLRYIAPLRRSQGDPG